MTRKSSLIATAVGVPSLLCASSALGGAHTWDIVEAFSNSDGTIQFIELMECCGGQFETGLNNKAVTSLANSYLFTANLPAGSSSFAHILLGTAGYAALPGAVPPDHIIVANFFDVNDDFLEYHIYDDFDFGPGQLPTNGKNSLNRSGVNLVSAPASPTNFAGQTGQIDACPWDTNGDGATDTVDFLNLLGLWGTDPGGPPDFDGSGSVDTVDFLELLGHWGPC